MKRILALMLASIMLICVSVAYAADYSSMTEAQLKEQLDAIRNELLVKGLKAENKTVIVDQANIQIYISGDIKIDKPYSWASTYNLYIPIIVINNTNQNITMLVENSSINGWSTNGSQDGASTPAGKKSKAYLVFGIEDTEVEKIEDFTDAEFSLRVYDDNTWKDLFVTKAITIYAK